MPHGHRIEEWAAFRSVLPTQFILDLVAAEAILRKGQFQEVGDFIQKGKKFSGVHFDFNAEAMLKTSSKCNWS